MYAWEDTDLLWRRDVGGLNMSIAKLPWIERKGEIRCIDEREGKIRLVSRLSSRAPRLSRILSVSSRPPIRGRADIAMDIVTFIGSRCDADVWARNWLQSTWYYYWRITSSVPNNTRFRDPALGSIGALLPSGRAHGVPVAY